MKKLFLLPALFVGQVFAQTPPAPTTTPSAVATTAVNAADKMNVDMGIVAVAVLSISVALGLFVIVRGFLKRP
jgi:hypothetical protein